MITVIQLSMAKWKIDYIGHDKAYKKRKAEGQPGWGTAEDFKETIGTLEKMLDKDYVPKIGRLLELGCGAGDISFWLVEKGFDVYGVDIAPTAIDWAREKSKERKLKADFQIGNVLDLKNYNSNFFDFVFDGHCFHCIIGEDRKLFLASAYRVLKPGGLFYVNTMCGEVCDPEVKKHFDPESRCLVYGDIAARYIGLPGDILNEIEGAGFRILNSEGQEHNTGQDRDNLVVDEELFVYATK